jgi:hypothetical protein
MRSPKLYGGFTFMKKMFLIISITFTVIMLVGCGQSNKTATKGDNNQIVGKESPSQNNEKSRISFDRNKEDSVSYKQHVKDLWEKTKPLLRDDLANNLSDEQYKKLGAEIDEAWVNLQIHSSLHHKAEVDSIKDVGLSNLDGNIIGLIDELYGNRDSGSLEKREKRRETLKKSRLEYKIKEFDTILQGWD